MNTYVQDIYHKCADWLPSYIWYVIVLVAFFCILRSMFRKKNLCIAKTENGKIFVTKLALQELVAFIARELGAHGSIKIIVYSRRNSINLDIVLKSSDCNNLQEFSHALYEKLHEIIEEKIGIGGLRKINVIVSRFALNKNTILPQIQALDE